MDRLTKQEAAKTKSFLADNAALLADAGVQAELQKMIVTSKKKALKLQQDQDDERWKSDMPPTKEIQETVELGLQDLRQMQQQHVESEMQSPDHHTQRSDPQMRRRLMSMQHLRNMELFRRGSMRSRSLVLLARYISFFF